MNLREAQHAAKRIQSALIPFCLPGYCAIAGSVRRRKPDNIKDIEIVAISKPPRLEFGGSTLPQLHKFLEDEYWMGRIAARKNSKFQNIAWGGLKFRAVYWQSQNGLLEIKLDIFIVQPQQWGAAMAIRTGPAEFSRRLVMPKNSGGWMPKGMVQRDFCLWQNDKLLFTATEESFFLALGLPFIQPEDRMGGIG